MSDYTDVKERLEAVQDNIHEARKLVATSEECFQQLRTEVSMLRADLSGYLLFAGADYYPVGGWDDLVTVYKTIDDFDPRDLPSGRNIDSSGGWWHLINIATGATIKEGVLKRDN